jgi:diguanylate cyclase (GGDEF)-like protein/PAS domain S-box-containing protein
MQHFLNARHTGRRRPQLTLSHRQPCLEEQINTRTGPAGKTQRLIERILDLAPGGLCLLDVRQDRFVYVNQPDLTFFGVSEEVFLSQGQAFTLAYFHPDDIPAYHALRAKLEAGEDSAAAKLRARNSLDGGWSWLNFRGHVIERETNGSPWLILFVAVDITTRREAEEMLRYTSTHDALTGLYNWAYFEETLERTHRGGVFPVSIIMMDVDNLKTINDSIGHIAGDDLLRRICGLLQSAFRAEDILARLGGDEFAALLPGVNAAGASQVVQRIRAQLAEATHNSGLRLDLLSIGHSTAAVPNQLQTARHKADQDMYRDKQQRKF